MKALHVKSLSRHFGNFRAVDNISFDVARGEVFGFLGANGAGKSTTIRMLCGILPPTSGQAELMGIDVIADPARVKLNIGYMSQKFSLYQDLTVKENIEFFAGIHGIRGRILQRRMNEILEMAELRGMEKRITGSLPGGWKQKLALGCSLVHNPGVIFLDEPTAGVDPAARRLFWDIIYEIRSQGATVFVTSHYMDEVEQCDRVAMMHAGKIAALDTPENLKRNLLPGPVLEISGEDVDAIKKLLDQNESVIRVDPFGRGLHVILSSRWKGKAKEALQYCSNLDNKLWVKGKLKGTIVEPGLEDVFVYLIGTLEAGHVS